MTKINNSYEHKPASGGKPRQMVMLLHGYGSDGADLIGLAPMWARDLPDAVFISPDAPFPCEMGFGHQWFTLQDRDPVKMLKGVQGTMPILKTFIEVQLKKYDLTLDRLALAGFSQGTMMSLYTGPRLGAPIAGILGYSGALVWEPDVQATALNKVPVHLIHGDADEVVPAMAYHHAHKTLDAHGFAITGGITPGLTHSIDPQGLQDGADFLKSILL
ncbi:MAG: alpha/beta hydrolase [Alphaproteobacteria bacterium]